MDDQHAGKFPIMLKHARKRRSLVPSLHLLEGRHLLSASDHLIVPTSVSHALIADRDDGSDAAEDRTMSDRLVPASNYLAESDDVVRESSNPARTKPELTKSPSLGHLSGDLDESSPMPTSVSVIARSPDSPLTSTSDDLESSRLQEMDKRSDLPLNLKTASAPAASGMFNPVLPASVGDGKASSTSPPMTMPALMPTPNSESVPDVGIESVPDVGTKEESEDVLPLGAGLITQANPFSSHILSSAAEKILDQIEDSELLDLVADMMTYRTIAFGTTCVAAVGTLEIVRRLHHSGSDRVGRRMSLARMVPGLWPTRLS